MKIKTFIYVACLLFLIHKTDLSLSLCVWGAGMALSHTLQQQQRDTHMYAHARRWQWQREPNVPWPGGWWLVKDFLMCALACVSMHCWVTYIYLCTFLLQVELFEFKGEDITENEDGGIIRRIITKGEGYSKPNEGATVEGWHQSSAKPCCHPLYGHCMGDSLQ